jgi:hypothetical protein
MLNFFANTHCFVWLKNSGNQHFFQSSDGFCSEEEPVIMIFKLILKMVFFLKTTFYLISGLLEEISFKYLKASLFNYLNINFDK